MQPRRWHLKDYPLLVNDNGKGSRPITLDGDVSAPSITMPVVTPPEARGVILFMVCLLIVFIIWTSVTARWDPRVLDRGKKADIRWDRTQRLSWMNLASLI